MIESIGHSRAELIMLWRTQREELEHLARAGRHAVEHATLNPTVEDNIHWEHWEIAQELALHLHEDDSTNI